MMITLRNVTTPAESRSTSVLDAVTLTIHEGEVVSVVGLSSARRRRILGLLGLYADDWSGEYELFEHAIHRLDERQRAGVRGELVGAMMRCAPLVECLSVEENLEIPLSYRGVPPADRTERIDDALARLGVQSIRAFEVGTLPADQMQLVGIAKALVSNPRLVLLEDPALHLSQLQLRLVRRQIERLRNDGRIVVQSSDRPESGLDADRVIDLDGLTAARRSGSRSSVSRLGLSSAATHG